MTLTAIYDIGQFDIKEFKILKKISFHIFFHFSFLKTQCLMLYKCLNNVKTFVVFFVVCCMSCLVVFFDSLVLRVLLSKPLVGIYLDIFSKIIRGFFVCLPNIIILTHFFFNELLFLN